MSPRPNLLLRADTLDLQDTENPSASEHGDRPYPLSNGNAPHLAAKVHQVLEERHSEELSLQDAFGKTTTGLASQFAAEEQAKSDNGGEHVTNGAAHEGGNGSEAAGTETDGDGDGDIDADDDMMDRISSSPSIDEGGYSQRSPSLTINTPLRLRRWPARSTSLSPASTPTPTRESFNQTFAITPDSSPFTSTPQHLPLRSRMGGLERSPLASQWVCKSSPCDDDSNLSPFNTSQSKHHHSMGRYPLETGLDWSPNRCASANDDPQEASRTNDHSQMDSKDPWSDDAPICESRRIITSPIRTDPFEAAFRQKSLESFPSLSSVDSIDLGEVLLPIDDPLLDAPPSPDGSAASWESVPGSDLDRLESDNESDDNDDDNDAFFNLDDRFIDSGWGGECLRDAEDIDFEFVYALHTFVATVEGQANATKGDTMVLLDDTNSYWWLVRVVKDSSIGYLPAEHIETPTERLARLNKHRNIDLSATMLSDNSEKTRNPLKKAIRRRNGKTVQFAAPTYVEASDYDYSTDDEDQMIDPPYPTATQTAETSQEEPQTQPEEAKKSDIQHPEAERRSSTGSNRASFDREQAATAAQALAEAGVTGDVVIPKTEAAPLKSKRTRNTDSFLRDDTIETRKITLTPGLLRDETSSLKSPTSESTRSSSFETITKTVSPEEKTKKDPKDKKKEEKAKKGGMLSGLFKSKKKDKKSKEEVVESGAEKGSSDSQRDSPRASPLPSGKSSPIDKVTNGPPIDKVANGPPIAARNDGSVTAPESTRRDEPQEASQTFVAELEGSTVAHEMATVDMRETGSQQQVDSEAAQQEKSTGGSLISSLSNPLSPIANALKPADKEAKPPKATRAKQRVELDDFDSPLEDAQNPFENKEEPRERLSESPVEVASPNTFMHGTESIHIPMPGQFDNGEETAGNEDETDGPDSLTSSPSIIEHPAEPIEEGDTKFVEDDDPTPTARSPLPTAEVPSKAITHPQRGLSTDSNTTTSSSSFLSPKPSPTVSQQAWNDDSLKAWLDNSSEVRDMLVMIHDKTGVKRAPPNHPLMADLYVEQRKGVQDMMGQLDGLLATYLQRKGVKY